MKMMAGGAAHIDDSRDVAIPGDGGGDEVVRLERRQQADEEEHALHCDNSRLPSSKAHAQRELNDARVRIAGGAVHPGGGRRNLAKRGAAKDIHVRTVKLGMVQAIAKL